jgi:hypothetical protein
MHVYLICDEIKYMNSQLVGYSLTPRFQDELCYMQQSENIITLVI